MRFRLLHRPDEGVDHGVRGRDVGIADPQVDDIGSPGDRFRLDAAHFGKQVGRNQAQTLRWGWHGVHFERIVPRRFCIVIARRRSRATGKKPLGKSQALLQRAVARLQRAPALLGKALTRPEVSLEDGAELRGEVVDLLLGSYLGQSDKEAMLKLRIVRPQREPGHDSLTDQLIAYFGRVAWQLENELAEDTAREPNPSPGFGELGNRVLSVAHRIECCAPCFPPPIAGRSCRPRRDRPSPQGP